MKTLVFTLALMSGMSSFANYCNCNGEDGTIWINDRHTNDRKDGGCVSDQAFVSENVFIGGKAKVCGGSFVSGYKIRIYGDALIQDYAEIEGNNIRIGSGAIIGGTAKVKSNSVIMRQELTDGTYEGVTLNGFQTNSYKNYKKHLINLTNASMQLGTLYTENTRTNQSAKYRVNFTLKSECTLEFNLDYYTDYKSNYQLNHQSTINYEIDLANNKLVDIRKMDVHDMNKVKFKSFTTFVFQKQIYQSKETHRDDPYDYQSNEIDFIEHFNNRSTLDKFETALKGMAEFCQNKK